MLPDTQLFLRPGIVEMGWGHPDPVLLPVADLARATEVALRQAGPAALSYGAEQGPGQLLMSLAAWFFAGGDERNYLRLAFSLLTAKELDEGVRRVSIVLRTAPRITKQLPEAVPGAVVGAKD